MNNQVRLDLIRPIGSFDHVEVICPVELPQVIFNNAQLQTSVHCSFLPNTPLMNFVILTVKQGFNSGVLSISREGNFNPIFLIINSYSFSTSTNSFQTFSQ